MQIALREFWRFAETEGGLFFWRTEEHDRNRFEEPALWVTYFPSSRIEVSLDRDIHYDPLKWEEIKGDFTSLGEFSKEEVEEMLSPSMIGNMSSYAQLMDEIDAKNRDLE